MFVTLKHCPEYQPFRKGIILSLLIEKIIEIFQIGENLANICIFPQTLNEIFEIVSHLVYENVKMIQKREASFKITGKCKRQGTKENGWWGGYCGP